MKFTWPTRTALAWDLAFIASALTFIASHTHLIPPAHASRVEDVSVVLGFLSARLALSTVGESSQKRAASDEIDTMNA